MHERARPERSARRAGAACAVAALLAGCVQNGREWVHAPIDDDVGSPRERLAPDATPWSAASPASGGSPNRGRITRTITLGESLTPGAPPSPSSNRSRAEGPGATTFVESSSYRAPRSTSYGWGGSGWGPRYPSYPSYPEPRASTPRAAPPMQVGDDWQKPPSYGPAFPFRTGPASPWAR